jgi:putative intracellular protease/amidase
MKNSISKNLMNVFLLIFAFTANTFAQTTSEGAHKNEHTKKVIIVLSSEDTWIRKDGSKYATGYWAEEFVDIYKKFIESGYAVDIATPGGKKAIVDPHSINPEVVGKEKAEKFIKYLASIIKELNATLSLDKVGIDKYDAIIVPGGHGPVVDLYKDTNMGKLLFDAQNENKIIGVVCHGQAALLSAVDAKGNWLFKGRTMTAFSDEEEVEFGTADNAPWLLASALRKKGANYKRGTKNWEPFVITDGNLISGQNPSSSLPMAETIINVLSN